MTQHTAAGQAIVGEPEVVEDASTSSVEDTQAWHRLKDAAIALQGVQAQDGSVPEVSDHDDARAYVETIVAAIRELSPWFPHDAE
jgi:hypothetical protein